MGAVVEQIQQTYELQVNGYYSQLHLVEDYILRRKKYRLKQMQIKTFLRHGKKKLEAG